MVAICSLFAGLTQSPFAVGSGLGAQAPKDFARALDKAAVLLTSKLLGEIVAVLIFKEHGLARILQLR